MRGDYTDGKSKKADAIRDEEGDKINPVVLPDRKSEQLQQQGTNEGDLGRFGLRRPLYLRG
jgi:hypothetical protein